MTATLTKSAFLAACAISMFAGPVFAAESGIAVIMNQAKIVKLSRPADTVVIGNPNIADAAVKDPKTIVITGKGFGVTNFVVLDVAGNPIVDEQIEVSRSVARTIRIYRRATVQTLSCTPFCETSYRSQAEIDAERGVATANQ